MDNVLGLLEKKEKSEFQNDYTQNRETSQLEAGFMLIIGEKKKKKASISLNQHTVFFKMRIVLTNFLKNTEHIKTSAIEGLRRRDKMEQRTYLKK